jgi:hypothetical protein
MELVNLFFAVIERIITKSTKLFPYTIYIISIGVYFVVLLPTVAGVGYSPVR